MWWGAGNEKSGNIADRHPNDNGYRLSIHGNIVKKSAKSPKYRRNIGEAPINRRKIASGSESQGLKIGKYRLDNGYRLLIHGNIVKKSAKSPKYRWSTDKSEKNREWIWRAEQPEVFLPIFRKISRYFLPGGEGWLGCGSLYGAHVGKLEPRQHV